MSPKRKEIILKIKLLGKEYSFSSNYIRENWGIPFIGLFQILLVIAGFLVSSNTSLANKLAIYAYYSLVLGIILQYSSFLKNDNSK
jgi:hypothetical protein